jgi:ECF transporter, substrate-specific component
MKVDARFAARVALFAALAYILALASVYIPNVSLSFIAVFAGGALFGLKTGISAGGLGMFLWTVFNPYGIAVIPVTIAQIGGMMLVGALGATVAGSMIMRHVQRRGFWIFALLGTAGGLLYQIIVGTVNAWMFGPFWASLSAGLIFSLATIISNALIFPACYPLIVRLANRERR